jgi:surface protein
MMKKTRLLFTAFALLMSATAAMADNVLYAEFSDEDDDGTKETMTLKYGDSNEYYFTGTRWEDFTDALKKTITMIDVDKSCKYFTGTSLQSLFYDFINVTAINNLKNLNTANVTNMKNLFFYCKALQSLDISSFDTSKVTDMEYMFSYCMKMTTLTLGDNFNTENVTTMKSMFGVCHTLQAIDLSKFNTATVTTMKAMFANCRAVTTLDLSTFNTAKVEDMSSMFSNCLKLTSITFGQNFTTANVTDMGGMFISCELLTSLDLSGFNTAKVTSMLSMFRECYALQTLVLGENFVTSKVTDMRMMFRNCQELASLDLSTFNVSGVTSMKEMFSTCQKLVSLDLSTFNTQSVTDMSSMFYNCSKLKSIIVGDDWNTNSVTSSTSMFYNCQKLVGEDGTAYNASAVSVDKAHTDEGGYLTKKTETLTTTADGEGNYWRTYYNANVGCVADENTTVYTVKVNQNKSAVSLTAVADNVIPADNAVVLKSDKANISMTRVAETSKLENNELRGSQSDVATGDFANEGTVYTLAKGNEGLNFYKFNGNTLKANHAFLLVPGAGVRVIKLGNDETTGVEKTTSREPANDDCYDLQGRRIAQPSKGLYIINGKKVVK